MSLRFRRHLKQHQDRVYTLCVYLLRDRAEAEDVTQETFIKLWQRLDEVDPKSVAAWLTRVARNGCLDRIRRRRPEGKAQEAADHTGPLYEAERRELGSALRGAIVRLKEPYRSLVVLRDVQQHSYQEIGALLGLTLAQVKTYLHRARRQLREQLSETMKEAKA